MIQHLILSPSKIKRLTNSKDQTIGKFVIKPLMPGFGITLGNALRRVLISSLEGYAIYYIMIPGVTHEFSYIDGVIENLTEIILNLKQIRFKLKSPIYNKIPKHYTIFLNKKKEQITAGDLCGSITSFEVLNPKLVILTKELDANLNITLGIKKGVGYVPVETKKSNKRGKIPLDTIFSPIINVRFKVETCEVHHSYSYDSLILEIRTDCSITPQKALKKASSILIQHFTLFFHGNKHENTSSKESLYSKEIRKVLYSKLYDRKCAQINTWADLGKCNQSDLLKGRNFGMKSFDELNKKINNLGLDYGMDLSKDQLQISKNKKRIRTFREKMRQIVKLRNLLKRRQMTPPNETQK